MTENTTSSQVLVINAGSSSLKYALFHGGEELRGSVEGIGTSGSFRQRQQGREKRELTGHTLADAFAAMREWLPVNAGEVAIVGHRFVQGGARFVEPTIVTDDVLSELDRLTPLAPLHVPVNVEGVRLARKAFPASTHVAVFDTAFHHGMPPRAFLYGLPYDYFARDTIRRFGFHGTSHQYVSREAARFLGRPIEDLRIVSCHLGNGASVCAIERGRSIDTSMGFTPGEGLLMGTRCGDVDAGVLTYLLRRGMAVDQVDDLLNHQGGLLGISGVSGDMREVERAAAAGNERAATALDAFCYRVRKYVGAYAAALGGIDVLVFTAGIGEGSVAVRERTCAGLEFLGVLLDPGRNASVVGPTETRRISRDGAPVEVLVVPTDEERAIADEVVRVA